MIKMKGIAINQYISDFVRLAEDVPYDLGATGTWRFFLRGLPRDMGIEVIKANPQNWATLRQTAIDATNAWNHHQQSAQFLVTFLDLFAFSPGKKVKRSQSFDLFPKSLLQLIDKIILFKIKNLNLYYFYYFSLILTF